MRVLITCEFSGTVRDEFIALGHEAMSCDLLPTEKPGPHYQGDVFDVLYQHWDLMIAHPPCTYLANSGVCHLYNEDHSINSARWILMLEGAKFFRKLCEANHIPRRAIENPIQHRYAVEAHGQGRPTQYIQPWQFGHGESKRTGLHLYGLPKLVPTDIVEGREQRLHLLPPSEDRWKLRSMTYKGIAKAMAQQWGSVQN